VFIFPFRDYCGCFDFYDLSMFGIALLSHDAKS